MARSRRDQAAASRAEARRRARLAARGELVEEAAEAEQVPEAAVSRRPPGGFLANLFPPAPPLPGKGDPLAGFSYAGPRWLRGAAISGWALNQRPYAWLGMGALWFAARLVTWTDELLHGGIASWVGIGSSFVSFGALIAAGWIGWRRPWFYGLAAAVVGVALFAVTIMLIVLQNPPEGLGGSDVLAAALAQEGFQIFFGILGGWYGGYFRRRTAAQRATTQRPGQRPRRR